MRVSAKVDYGLRAMLELAAWSQGDIDQIFFAEVIRAIEGPPAGVRGVAAEDAEYEGAAEHMREFWIATRSAMRDVLESVTLAGALTGEFDSPGGTYWPAREPGSAASVRGPRAATTRDRGTPTDTLEVMEWSTP